MIDLLTLLVYGRPSSYVDTKNSERLNIRMSAKARKINQRAIQLPLEKKVEILKEKGFNRLEAKGEDNNNYLFSKMIKK